MKNILKNMIFIIIIYYSDFDIVCLFNTYINKELKKYISYSKNTKLDIVKEKINIKFIKTSKFVQNQIYKQ